MKPGDECPKCAAAREHDKSIAEGYLHSSGERPGMLFCNACGKYFSADELDK